MPITNKITPCLWFDSEGQAAAEFYTGIFRNSSINGVARYTEEGKEVHHKPAGSAMVVQFELDGQSFTALNGGPKFKFTEAISLQVGCADQQEIDYFWENLGEGGDPKAQQCGWLKDKFGLSWQIVPARMGDLFKGPNAGKVMQAMLAMKKIDIAALEKARDG